MIPGITGIVMPAESLAYSEAHTMKLTFRPYFFEPFQETIDIIKELGDNEVCTCIDFVFKVS